ncbi:MAG: hypothetical protein Q9174_000127 [Haloplaca sp. 1 TL-2023]
MASTRRFQIFQDPSDVLLQHNHNNDDHDDTIMLRPTMMSTKKSRSPLKPTDANKSTLKPIFGPIKKIPIPPTFPYDKTPFHLTDSLSKQSHTSFGRYDAPTDPEKAVFGDLPAYQNYGQENRPPLNHEQHGDGYAAFPGAAYPIKSSTKPPAAKRATAVPSASQGRSSMTASEDVTQTQSHLPLPENLPTLVDNHKKPPYSYSKIIGMAILRAKDRRLTLDQLYTWIAETFSFFRLEDGGWKNSIRHNLSIHKEFQKLQRSKDDPGKGNYWIIQPGKEQQFLMDKPSRRSVSACGPTMKTFSQPLNESSSEVCSLPAKVDPKPILRPASAPEQPSSDATIPASDPGSPGGLVESVSNMAPPAPPVSFSSPVGSSPPVEFLNEIGDDFAPVACDISLPPTKHQSRKRKSVAMDDSGYFSSIDSSATRGFGTAHLGQVEDMSRPRLKRGRAEEEIARIRSSSHDASPSKGRSMLPPVTPRLDTSSPLRFEIPQLKLKMTPLLFDLPPKPPSSISPSTTLLKHRKQIDQLVFDPSYHNLMTSPDDTPFSPQFEHLMGDPDLGYGNDEHTSLDMSNGTDPFAHPALFPSSPLKASVRRSRPARLAKMGNALADITNTNGNRKLLATAHKALDPESPSRPSSAKSRMNRETGDTLAEEDFLSRHFLADNDEDEGEGDGIDLSQGFRKIGREQYSPPKSRRAARPQLDSRSQTSRV